MHPRLAGPGEILIKQGEPGDTVFILVIGAVRVLLKRGDAGDDETTELVRVTDQSDLPYFGEMALHFERPRTASVEAIEHSFLLAIPRANFAALTALVPDFGKRAVAREANTPSCGKGSVGSPHGLLGSESWVIKRPGGVSASEARDGAGELTGRRRRPPRSPRAGHPLGPHTADARPPASDAPLADWVSSLARQAAPEVATVPHVYASRKHLLSAASVVTVRPVAGGFTGLVGRAAEDEPIRPASSARGERRGGRA